MTKEESYVQLTLKKHAYVISLEQVYLQLSTHECEETLPMNVRILNFLSIVELIMIKI